MKTEKKLQKLIYVDEKILSPDEKVTTSDEKILSSKETKRFIGLPSVYDLNGKLLAKETNLVILRGREFLAQMLMQMPSSSGEDLTSYKLEYFSIGSGGTSTGGTPTTIGPYDNDLDLTAPAVFATTGLDSSLNNYKYIDNGHLKKITSDGSIEIIKEDHTINTSSGNLDVQRYTSIKFVLKITQTEPANKPFKFSEAGLFAVKYINGVPTSEKLLFARFTTLDKYLDTNDGILIEWHILV